VNEELGIPESELELYRVQIVNSFINEWFCPGNLSMSNAGEDGKLAFDIVDFTLNSTPLTEPSTVEVLRQDDTGSE
jgi:hypothetical protein